jgi:hypothetical protein
MPDEKILASVWQQRLQQVVNTTPADRPAAEIAVERLYHALGYPKPEIIWYKHERILPITYPAIPLRRVQESILYSLWLKLADNLDRALVQFGYNYTSGSFRLATNKPLVFANFRIGRTDQPTNDVAVFRPQWAHDLGNLVCQFDASVLALYDYAAAMQIPIDRELYNVGDAFKQFLDSTFGAVLFERSCVLIDRPQKISLDASNMLSSTSGPAYVSDSGTELYAVNGIHIPESLVKNTNNITWDKLNDRRSIQQRVALIEYIGWERFFNKVPMHRKQLIDQHPRWGKLYRINCGNLYSITHIIFVVQVINSTPEKTKGKDGKPIFREYVIPVDHMCRPIPNPLDPRGVLGERQTLTALNAVASTFGMRGEDYAAMLGDES